MEKIIFEDLPSTQTPINAENLNQIQSNVENAINDVVKKNIYSTDEHIVGIWMEKTLYRKVIDCGYLPNANSISIEHNISNLDKIVKISGGAIRDDGEILPIPYVTFNEANNGGINLYANTQIVYLKTTNNRTFYHAYIILEYTKTTD